MISSLDTQMFSSGGGDQYFTLWGKSGTTISLKGKVFANHHPPPPTPVPDTYFLPIENHHLNGVLDMFITVLVCSIFVNQLRPTEESCIYRDHSVFVDKRSSPQKTKEARHRNRHRKQN